MGKGKMNQKAAALKEQKAAAQKSAQAGKAGKPAQKKGGRTAADKAAVAETTGRKAETADRTAEEGLTKIFEERLHRHHDELRWLYMELYENDSMFAELCDQMYQFYMERNDELKKLDTNREKDKEWYKKNDMLGMMFYIDNLPAI